MSHADFERECLHCHAPVHCVTDTRCQDCHLDVARQRGSAEGLHARLPGTSRCQSCHPEHGGREVTITEMAFANLDHTRLAGFDLVHHREGYDGASLDCRSCHTLERFGRETLDCVSCHSDEDHEWMGEHIDQFGTDCLACHDGTDRMRDFDHERVYPLEGKHAEAACDTCHAGYVFAGVSQQCVDCHVEPEMHAGSFGLDCARCHTASAWAPAQLTRHTFPLDHGDPETDECQACHLETYARYTCDGCHDHQLEEMSAFHAAEGIEVLDLCANCHPTGTPGEADRLRQLEQQRTNDAAQAGGKNPALFLNQTGP